MATIQILRQAEQHTPNGHNLMGALIQRSEFRTLTHMEIREAAERYGRLHRNHSGGATQGYYEARAENQSHRAFHQHDAAVRLPPCP
jgi:hypothetical protein